MTFHCRTHESMTPQLREKRQKAQEAWQQDEEKAAKAIQELQKELQLILEEAKTHPEFGVWEEEWQAWIKTLE